MLAFFIHLWVPQLIWGAPELISGSIPQVTPSRCRLSYKEVPPTDTMVTPTRSHQASTFQIPIRPGNSGQKSHSVDFTEIPIIYLFYLFRVSGSFPVRFVLCVVSCYLKPWNRLSIAYGSRFLILEAIAKCRYSLHQRMLKSFCVPKLLLGDLHYIIASFERVWKQISNMHMLAEESMIRQASGFGGKK